MKKFVLCKKCHLFKDCKAGQAKMRGVNYSYQSTNDIGCWDCEQKQKQLKLAI